MQRLHSGSQEDRRNRSPYECRVRFAGRLRGISTSSVDELPTIRLPEPEPAPLPASIPVAAAPSAPAVIPQSADFWRTEIARELQTDREKLDKVLEAVRGATAQLQTSQRAQLRDWQRAAIELAMTVAARLLHERIDAGAFPVEAKVRDMIAQLEDEPVSIHLHPADIELLESRLAGEPLLPERDDPRIVPDPKLARGEYRVEGKESMLLADTVRELTEIREELLRSVSDARS